MGFKKLASDEEASSGLLHMPNSISIVISQDAV